MSGIFDTVARASSTVATALCLSTTLVGLGALAAEVEVVASTSTIAARGDAAFGDEVSFSAFVRSTGLRVGGVRLTHERQTAGFQLPTGQELLVRGFRVVPSSGKMAFCNGEAYLAPTADLRYQFTFDFEHNPSAPALSRCRGRLVALSASGDEVSAIDLTTEIVDEALALGSRTLRQPQESIQVRIEVAEEGRFVEVPAGELAQQLAKALKAGDPAPEVKLAESTRRIQATMGLKFGIRFRVVGVPEGYDPDYSVRVLPPASAKLSPQSGNPPAFGVRGVAEIQAIYVIENEDELVRGPWAFEVRHKTQLLATRIIELY